MSEFGSRWRNAVHAMSSSRPGPNMAPPPEFSEIFVLLAKGDGGNHIAIYINEDRLGTLTATDTADFLAILATADDGQPVPERQFAIGTMTATGLCTSTGRRHPETTCASGVPQACPPDVPEPPSTINSRHRSNL